MSYILDALKKSDQERQSQPLIDIAPVQSGPTTRGPKRKKWLWLVPALLLANIIVLIWPDAAPPRSVAAVSGNTVQPETSTTGTATPPAPAITDSDSQSESGITAPEPQPIGQDQRPDISVRPSYHRDPFAPLPGHNVPSPEEVVTTAADTVVDSIPTKPAVPLPDVEQLNRSLLNQALIEQLAPLREAQPSKPPTDAARALQRAAADQLEIPAIISDISTSEPSTSESSSSEPNSSAQQTLVENSNVPLLNELDPETQNAIPDLKVSVHIYAQTPEQRMARVNGKMIREGQRLTDDLRLEEIRPESLVFSFRGNPFLLLR
ncbi:Type II secretion system protein B [Amphritea atlantica]|uniref:Type II secretion system protein B n=1 Tax=Amphritea atlantica TaxID=355243 RepID=A0A1H9GPH6_9GAMM|nr:general secretion pathway protein GspB [Amphritea atlantica]SEQ51889.1 Type II secretion system protein B [Amphritea atlantica]